MKTSDNLRAAAALLEENTFAKGPAGLLGDEVDGKRMYCVEGALHWVLTHKDLTKASGAEREKAYSTVYNSAEKNAMMAYINKHLVREDEAPYTNHLFVWNDKSYRKKQDVLEALRGCADELDRK